MTTKQAASLGTRNGHAHCFMCGDRNPRSLGLSFQSVDADTVCARFQASPRLQGYEGILHGGVIAALLDAAMTHCLFHRGVQAITGELHVRFVQPVACDSVLDLRAWVLSVKSPLFRVRAEIVRDGRIMAWAEGKFLKRVFR